MSYHKQSKNEDHIVGVVLAGGQSLRMNREDKHLKTLDNKTLLSCAIDRLHPQVDKLILNVNEPSAVLPEYDFPVASDLVEGAVGPLAGIHSAMRMVQERWPEARYIVTVATDTPFIPKNLVSTMLQALSRSETDIAMARSQEQVHPVIGVWPVELADDLEATLKDDMRRVRRWAEAHNAIEVDFPMYQCGEAEIDPFFNVNTPEDLAKAEGDFQVLRTHGVW